MLRAEDPWTMTVRTAVLSRETGLDPSTSPQITTVSAASNSTIYSFVLASKLFKSRILYAQVAPQYYDGGHLIYHLPPLRTGNVGLQKQVLSFGGAQALVE